MYSIEEKISLLTCYKCILRRKHSSASLLYMQNTQGHAEKKAFLY